MLLRLRWRESVWASLVASCPQLTSSGSLVEKHLEPKLPSSRIVPLRRQLNGGKHTERSRIRFILGAIGTGKCAVGADSRATQAPPSLVCCHWSALRTGRPDSESVPVPPSPSQSSPSVPVFALRLRWWWWCVREPHSLRMHSSARRRWCDRLAHPQRLACSDCSEVFHLRPLTSSDALGTLVTLSGPGHQAIEGFSFGRGVVCFTLFQGDPGPEARSLKIRPSGGHPEAIRRPSGGHPEAIRRPSGGPH